MAFLYYEIQRDWQQPGSPEETDHQDQLQPGTNDGQDMPRVMRQPDASNFKRGEK